jgi:hypothetical protein
LHTAKELFVPAFFPSYIIISKIAMSLLCSSFLLDTKKKGLGASAVVLLFANSW